MIPSRNEGVEMGERVKPQSWAPSYQEECLAIHLHDEFCTRHGQRGEKFPPDTWCDFFREGNWASPVHQYWLKKAREIIGMLDLFIKRS